MVRQVVMQKTPGIFKVAPCLSEELVMGIAHIVHGAGVFIVHGTNFRQFHRESQGVIIVTLTPMSVAKNQK